MFNRNTFFQHTTNTTNHNKMTQAGVKAPFSMNEQLLPEEIDHRELAQELMSSMELRVPNFQKQYDESNMPRTQSGDTRTDVSRTGSPGKGYLGGMVGRAGNAVAANRAKENQNMISSLFDSHVEKAYQAGIDTHGHWDLTDKDSNAIIDPHFDQYFQKVKAIDPNANRDLHYNRFDTEITDRARRLHGG
jgi:hypothetical protein